MEDLLLWGMEGRADYTLWNMEWNMEWNIGYQTSATQEKSVETWLEGMYSVLYKINSPCYPWHYTHYKLHL